MRVLRAVGTAVVVLAITFAVYAGLDWSAGRLLHRWNHWYPPDPTEVPGHRGQPYATSEFLLESLELGGYTAIPGTSLLMPVEIHGRYFNVDRLTPTNLFYRRTINSPDSGNPPETGRPEVTVLFLGGSNVYGSEVPDEMTIPSQLSLRLNELDPAHAYSVVNAAVTGADSGQERGRLAYEIAHGRKPDIVVVMDGGLDVLNGIYMAVPRQPKAAGRSTSADWFYRYVPLNIYRWLRAWGSEHAVALGLKHAPHHLADSVRLAQLTDATMAYYIANEIGMGQLASGIGSRFISVVEPNRYASDFEIKTQDLSYVDGTMATHVPGLQEILPRLLDTLSKAHAGLRTEGIGTLDLSSVFRDKTGDIFTTSPGHYNGTGSRIVAERIADTILHPEMALRP